LEDDEVGRGVDGDVAQLGAPDQRGVAAGGGAQSREQPVHLGL
jgi:hypothetical protein